MTINKALPGGNPSIVNNFISRKKKKKNKEKRKKKRRKRKEKRSRFLVCFVFVLSFSGFDDNTMELEFNNNHLVDSTYPDPRMLGREGEEVQEEEVLVDQGAWAKKCTKS